ncbi:hypothetical protein Cgig2_014419 [Carnegiea gigantea]|uniref:Transposase-associated domain-containing protein n=1 Tax=Carnegiea gigantea TaxID=171969 RepID=A0A9Q1GPG1_9CARY|nr:hypothetical protein Cgig2_014419 [Carnegiea gigantea]
MDSSWIELPNDHPDYLDGAVKFIKLTKENLVEGRTRCPCRRCKVEYIDVSTPEGQSKRTLNVLDAKSSTAAAQSLGHPTSNIAPAQPAEPASSLKASESLVQQRRQPILGLTSSEVLWPPIQPLRPPTGVLQPPTQPLRPPTVVAEASAEARGCSGQILPPPGTGAGASKLIHQNHFRSSFFSLLHQVEHRNCLCNHLPKNLFSMQHQLGLRRSRQLPPPPSTSIKASKPIVQQLTRCTAGSKLVVQQLLRPTSVNGGSASQPCLQLQPTTSIAALQPVRTPTSPNGATQPLIRPSTIKFGSTSQVSRESPSNGNNDHEDLARSSQSQSTDKGKGYVGGKQKKSSTSKSTRSSQSSWKDNIQERGGDKRINSSSRCYELQARVRFCVAFDNSNQPIRKGGYIFVRFLGYIARLERFCPIGTISWHKLNKTYKADIIEMVRSKFMYPADKCFDKHVLKHVAKHFKQYKHGLKKDYFKPEQKTKEAMYELVPKGHSRDGWMRLVDYWCSKEHEESQHIWSSLKRHMAKTTEASAKVQERLLSSSPSKTQVEIENEVFDELMCEEENPKRPIGFGFNVDRSHVFGVNSILRKRGYIFPNNNMELKRVKEELASQKAMFLLMLKAVCNGKITYEFLDATEAALRMAGDQVPQESSGNNLSNESGHAGPSTSASQVN